MDPLVKRFVSWRAGLVKDPAPVKHEDCQRRGKTAKCLAAIDLSPNPGEIDHRQFVSLGCSVSITGPCGRMPVPSGRQAIQQSPAE